MIAIWVNHKTWHLNIRTYLMAAVLLIVVAGFAMMAWGKNVSTTDFGTVSLRRRQMADLVSKPPSSLATVSHDIA